MVRLWGENRGYGGELRVIRDVILETARKYGVDVDGIILFGSRARGDYREDSDYDVLIIVKRKNELMEEFVVEAHRKIVRELSIPVDLLVVEKEYYEKYKNVYGDICGMAALEGKII